MINELAVFDLETTGVDVETDRIVTAYLGILTRDGETRELGRWLLNPGIPIPAGATAVHGITDEVAATGTRADQGIMSIAIALEGIVMDGIPLCVCNAAYDLTLLDREIRRHEVGIVGDIGGAGGFWYDVAPVIDPLVLDKATDKYRKGSRKLVNLAAHHGVPNGNAHDAAADAVMAGRVAFKLLEDVRLASATAASIHGWSIAWYRRQSASLADHWHGQGKDVSGIRYGWPYEDTPA